jgi:hypothetical protein
LSWWKLELTAVRHVSTQAILGQFLQLVGVTLAPVSGSGLSGDAADAMYHTDREIQRGARGLSYKMVDLSAIVFNPDEDKPTIACRLGRLFETEL